MLVTSGEQCTHFCVVIEWSEESHLGKTLTKGKTSRCLEISLTGCVSVWVQCFSGERTLGLITPFSGGVYLSTRICGGSAWAWGRSVELAVCC